jgi:hypothetical protein
MAVNVTLTMRAAATVGLNPTVGARPSGAGNRMLAPKWPFPSICEGLLWGRA